MIGNSLVQIFLMGVVGRGLLIILHDRSEADNCEK